MAAPIDETEPEAKDNSACLEASTETVIVTAARRGDGSPAAPFREVRQYWSMQGDILAEYDPSHDPSDGHPAEVPPKVPAGPWPGSVVPDTDTEKLESLWSVARMGMVLLEGWVGGNGTNGILLGDFVGELAKLGLRPQFPASGPTVPTYRMDNYANLHTVARAAHKVYDTMWTMQGAEPKQENAPGWLALREALKQAGFML